MPSVTIYEQDCHGQTQYRAMRDDGRPIIGQSLQVDFPTKAEAMSAVLGEFRRNKLGPFKMDFVSVSRQRTTLFPAQPTGPHHTQETP